MKTTFLALALLFSQGAFAKYMTINCQGEDFSVQAHVDLSAKQPHYIEIYSQGGLGPGGLESSYVATESYVNLDLHDMVKTTAKLPMDGSISIENEAGKFRMPGADKREHPISECKYTFN